MTNESWESSVFLYGIQNRLLQTMINKWHLAFHTLWDKKNQKKCGFDQKRCTSCFTQKKVESEEARTVGG